jgi:hypothetical protein
LDSLGTESGRNGPVRYPYFPAPEGLDWRTFRGPKPSPEFVQWLWALIPPGAPVIPLGTGPRDGEQAATVDAYITRGVPCLPFAADPKLSPIRPTRAQQISERMPEVRRRLPGRQAPRAGMRMWQLEAAFHRDLMGFTTAEIADAIELRDISSRNEENGSRSARRYVQAGRKRLVDLGAWPWLLEPETHGRLPTDWYTQQRYAEALAHWHHAAVTATLRDCLRTVEHAAGSNGRSHSTLIFGETHASYQRIYDAHRDPLDKPQPDA